MYYPPCHPESNGLSAVEVDKITHSALPSKVARAKAWCGDCRIQRECLALGFWVNDDNKRVALEGIFGGLTQNERKALL